MRKNSRFDQNVIEKRSLYWENVKVIFKNGETMPKKRMETAQGEAIMSAPIRLPRSNENDGLKNALNRLNKVWSAKEGEQNDSETGGSKPA